MLNSLLGDKCKRSEYQLQMCYRIVPLIRTENINISAVRINGSGKIRKQKEGK